MGEVTKNGEVPDLSSYTTIDYREANRDQMMAGKAFEQKAALVVGFGALILFLVIAANWKRIARFLGNRSLDAAASAVRTKRQAEQSFKTVKDEVRRRADATPPSS